MFKCKHLLVCSFAVLLLSISPLSNAGDYQVGSGIYDITGEAAESSMYGWVNFASTDGIQQRLFSRAFIVADNNNPSKRIVFVSADLGAIFQSVKLAVVRRLQSQHGNLYTSDNVMITATHSHVASGGTAHYPLHIIASFDSSLSGYSSKNFNAVVSGIVNSINRAHNNLAPGYIELAEGELLGATRNRSLDGYNQNVDKNNYQYDTNKTMTILKLVKDNGQEVGMINWFAIHNTSLSKKFTQLSGDNKGYAQYLFERDKNSDHRNDETFVAAFANSDVGDVVPSDGNANSAPGYEGSSNELLNAERAGERQYQKAVELYNGSNPRLTGSLEFKHVWQSMPGMSIRPEFGGGQWRSLCNSARGISFIAGGENGPSDIPGAAEGMTINNTGANAFEALFNNAPPLITLLQGFAGGTGLGVDDPCHHDKPVLISTGDLDWVPQILPFQIFVVGNLAIIGAPSEVNTMAGRRIRDVVLQELAPMGVDTAVIAGLANTYSGYLATEEEYQTQQYEGASTEFGKYSLASYMQIFHDLSEVIVNGGSLTSTQPPNKSGEFRSERAGVVADGKFFWERWGQVLSDANAQYSKGQTVSVTFRGAHPKNNLRTQDSFLTVQRRVGSNWVDYAHDWDWYTSYRWERKGIDRSDIEITWRIPNDAPSGTYRIRHQGDKKTWFQVSPYSGTSRSFSVQ